MFALPAPAGGKPAFLNAPAIQGRADSHGTFRTVTVMVFQHRADHNSFPPTVFVLNLETRTYRGGR